MTHPTYLHLPVEGQARLFAVGFFNPEGKWVEVSLHASEAAAAGRVHYLHGGAKPVAPIPPAAPSPNHEGIVDALVFCRGYLGCEEAAGSLSGYGEAALSLARQALGEGK